MLVKSKTINNLSSSKKNITKISNFGNLNSTKTPLKDLFKYFTVNIPEVLIGKADAKAIEIGKKEIGKGGYLSLDELILKMKSN